MNTHQKKKEKRWIKSKGEENRSKKKKNQKSDRFTGCFADFDCVEALV